MERANKAPIAEVAAEVRVRKPKKKEEAFLVSIGSTLLNCAMSDNYLGGIAQGTIINVIGESSAGKTMVCETMLAEAANDPKYDDYTLILDDAEYAHAIDTEHLFGKKAAERITAPRYDEDGEPMYSSTVEQFFANINRVLDSGDSVIYCLDSLDTLSDDAEMDKAEEYVKVADGKKSEVSGSYGMAKAKLLSQLFRTINQKLADTKSILVIISQTRDNVGAVGPASPKTRRAGGKALEFYCTHTVWLTCVKSLTAEVDGEKIKIGNQVQAEVKKNKFTGKVRKISFPIYYDYGIDDIASCVDFLIDCGYIKKAGAYYSWPGWDKMHKNKLISKLEDENLIDELRKITGEHWLERESKISLGRKPRFE